MLKEAALPAPASIPRAQHVFRGGWVVQSLIRRVPREVKLDHLPHDLGTVKR